jgi:iron complex outermembrane receptor protein
VRPADGNNYRQFHTFSQEVRLNGEAFGGKLNWLIGGYYSKEDVTVVDNLKFGSQYGAFAACRIVATINPSAALRSPNAPGCLSPTGRAVLSGLVPGTNPAFGAATPAVLAGIDRLSTLNNLGDTRSAYYQNSQNFAFFTHNVFKLTNRLSLTGGLRYTHEKKDFHADINNNNIVCPAQQAALGPLLASPALQQIVGGIITLTCTGNSTSQLTGVPLKDSLKEGEFTGTAVLSWKPIDELLTYASYSRGYKAGGYNLDRSDLSANVFSTPTSASASRLRFDPETVNAYEIGFKYKTRQFSLNVAGFRQEFANFQLNTFNGTNYVVQNIGSCSNSLNGADRDNSSTTGVCTAKVKYGVLSQGVEIEAGIYPARNFAVNLGYTLADTHYKNNLVGSQSGEALDAALFLLPGRQLSNAPRNVVTVSTSWSPEIGSSGLSALFYADGRLTSDYNTGSDLFVEKAQDGFFLMNARVGLHKDDQKWSIELWSQNLLNTKYEQVAFNAPFQGAGSIDSVKAFGGTGNQVFAAFLGEPRTYGVTLRSRF